MSQRKSLSKKVRFEVFKRDSFKCQYCGKSSPDVVLEVDHIHPVSKGGENDIMNLVTSCRDCNAGKSDRELGDDSAIQRQRKQLEDLEIRREQLSMMVQWREGLDSIDEDAALAVVAQIDKTIAPHAHINEKGRDDVRKWLKKFSVSEILDAMDDCLSRHEMTSIEDVEKFFGLIPKIAAMRRKPESERRLLYIRGIVRNRMYCNESLVMTLMKDALRAGAEIEWIEETAKTSRNWTEFRQVMQDAADDGWSA